MVIKKRTNASFYTYAIISAFIVFGILGVCLIFELRYFHTQAQALCDLKEDYSRYVATIKKIMHDYNKTKEHLDLLENYLENEKKKETIEGRAHELIDAELSSPFSTWLKTGLDNGPSSQDEEFVIINRELSYLRDCALAYILQEHDTDFFYQIPEDEWIEYTEYLDKGLHPEQVKSPIMQVLKKPRKRTVRKRRPNGMPISSDILFIWPVERSKCWLSSLFGPRPKCNGSPGFHYGLDMAAFRGTPVKAASSGIVMEARYARCYGKTILIAHNRKYKTRYAHLDKMYVSVGQKINRGQVIGLVGSTGTVRTIGKDGSHLHFEVYTFNRRVNPLYFLLD